MPDTFYITTPIYYVNGLPHIGTSYTTIAADVLARYHRSRGDEVLFLTGTDENAPKVAEVARELNQDPQAFVDAMSAEFRRVWDRMDITYDQFIRTTEPRHINLVQDIFARLRDQGDIYKGTYEGFYCVPDETFWTETQVVRGDDGVAYCPNPECRRPVQRVSEENYFFRLSAYSDRLMAHIEANPNFLAPAYRRNEVIQFIRDGLRDVSITRKGTGWGIPVPGDADFVVYVWFDALINYLTAVGYGTDEALFAKWWPANVQLMGKDIFVRFHSTFWPAMLMALGVPLPERLFGHGFWTLDGEKIGKSKGNAIDPYDLAVEVSQISGAAPEIAADAIRYVILRDIPFGQDGDFSRSALVSRFNSDLANDLGNLLNRTLALVNRLFVGTVPPPHPDETALAGTTAAAYDRATEALDDLRLNEALEAIWTAVSAGNKYIDGKAPWALHKAGDVERAGGVLYAVLDTLRSVALMIRPTMPHVAAAMWDQLGIATPLAEARWQDAREAGALPAGTEIRAGQPIFPRIDPKRKMTDQPRPASESTPAAPAEAKEDVITIDDFKKVKLKVARILTAERVPKADKLLHLTVDAGEGEPRELVAGIAAYYTPEELVGKDVVIVANLAPATIRGIRSNGMILAAESDGKVVVLGPMGEVAPGAGIR